MICKICGVNETDNPDGICDDCEMSIISNNDISIYFLEKISMISFLLPCNTQIYIPSLLHLH